MHKYDPITHLTLPASERNWFRDAPQDLSLPPVYENARGLLPEPIWDGHDSALACYWKVWELAFAHSHPATLENGYAAPFLDTHFNGHLFLWDSVFALEFCRYGRQAYDFQKTLDTFYRKQHKDGFISRELTEDTGEDGFHRFDPCSTGPNIFAWSEWTHFLATGDKVRLERVYPVLLAYHQWLRLYRSWPDGSYWYTGWGGGLDNQRRHRQDWLQTRSEREELERRWFLNGHLSWVEATAHQLMSARILLKIATLTGETEGKGFLEDEESRLASYIDDKMWNSATEFYHDRNADGSLSPLKSVVAYWTLLAGAVRPERLKPFLAHLERADEFATPHWVSSISRDDPDFDDDGDYWNGGVWPPTTCMVVRGLEALGEDRLAGEIARNHFDNVLCCFEETGTVWENYSPSGPRPSKVSKPDNVGWSGLAPVAFLFEHVFGLKSNLEAHRITWNIHQTDRHGVRRYPFGAEGLVDLVCEARNTALDEPRVTAYSSEPLDLEIRWPGGNKIIHCEKSGA